MLENSASPWGLNQSADNVKSFLSYQLDLNNTSFEATIAHLQKNTDNYSQFRGLLGQKDTIFEAGCGTGEGLLELSHLFPTASISGMDINPSLLEEGRKLASHFSRDIALSEGDLSAVAFPDNSFDLYCSKRVFQHLPEYSKALSEAQRIIKSTGHLLLIEPDRGSMLLNSSNRKLTRTICTFIEEVVTNPWLGRQLVGLMTKYSFRICSFRIHPIVLTSLKQANDNYALYMATHHLISTGIISQQEGLAWLTELEEKDKSGEFFCTFSLFSVLGIK